MVVEIVRDEPIWHYIQCHPCGILLRFVSADVKREYKADKGDGVTYQYATVQCPKCGKPTHLEL